MTTTSATTTAPIPTAAPIIPTRRRGSIYDARIAGLYDLEETIGRGHFAVVKLARHVFTGEKVAVKVIDKTKLDPVSKAHLFQEVRCMKLVQHPNIVRLYEVIDTATKLFLILELGDYDMYDYIMRQGGDRGVGVAEDEAQRYFCQIVRAISYCHQLHVVHRDLKPENVVFFEKLGMVKLTDFGFSNLFTPGQQLDTSCGSLAYSAPEILLGDAYEPPAVDVWSLGVILYMLVCGRLPFQEANDSETLTKILDCKFTLSDTLSEGCRSLIRRMLIRDPTKRATLKEIGECPWVCAGDLGHAELLPLVSRGHISEETHEHIVEQMVTGGVAQAEEILQGLNRDDYTSVTATYYLLAEQILRKERHKQAEQLLSAMTRSDSQLQLASLALSPRAEEVPYEYIGSGTSCTFVIGSDPTACVQVKSGHTTNVGQTMGPITVHHLISPMGKTSFDFDQDKENQQTTSAEQQQIASTSSSQPITSTLTTQEHHRLYRTRTCSIVREESEDEVSSVHIRSSRSASPAHSLSSPKISPSTSCMSLAGLLGKRISPPSLLELQEIAGKMGSSGGSGANVSGASSNGRTTPDRSGSRSPSPRDGRTSPVTSKYKTMPISGASGRKLQPISSSPQLLGICEEGEDEESLVGRQTYSTVRMIRPRQAVVSPDVIRRYDKRVSVSRSRRSTSCSSSETSDDEERRLCLIKPHCRKGDSNDRDDDQEPPSAGGGRDGNVYGRRDQKHGFYHHSSSNAETTSDNPNGSGGHASTTSAAGGGRRKQLDPRKLAHKLQKLALAPIREVPNIVLSRFGAGRTHLIEEARDWFRPLVKPKSCEHLPPSKPKSPATSKNEINNIIKDKSPSRDDSMVKTERKSISETSCISSSSSSSSSTSSSSSLFMGFGRTVNDHENNIIMAVTTTRETKSKHKVKKKRKCLTKLKMFVSGEVRFDNSKEIGKHPNFLALRTSTMASVSTISNVKKTR